MKKKHPPIKSNNRQMDRALEYLYKRIDQITPNIYAAFAIALDEMGWDTDQISELFARTQVIWADSSDRNEDMVTYCSEKLGIEVRAGKDADNN